MDSAKIWKAHTSTTTFAAAFDRVTEDNKQDNNVRTKRVEEFLITEAKAAGVIKSIKEK
jgi:hypothetical protein